MFFIIWSLLITKSWAAPMPQTIKAETKKMDRYYDSAIFIGGVSDKAFSVVDLKLKNSRKKQQERISILVGDETGKNVRQPGYFQVAIEKKPSRIIIDLAQTQRTAIDEKAIKAIFKKSLFVSEPVITMDPEDHSTNVVLNLRQDIRLEVFQKVAQSTENTSEIVLDLIK